MEQPVPTTSNRPRRGTPTRVGSDGSALQPTTQIAAWTVTDNHTPAMWRYVLRSDGKLVYRWKRAMDGRYISTPFALADPDCRTPEEAEELFAYERLHAIRMPARDGKPFRGLFVTTTTRRPI